MAAPDRSLFPEVQVEVAAQNLLRPDPQFLCNQLFQSTLFRCAAEQGQHIHLLVEAGVVVDLPVHVDGHAGNQQQIPVQGHQPGGDGVVLFHQHPARHGQGPIHPAGADHAAVALRVQLGVLLANVNFGIFLDLETGRVRVRRRYVEAVVFQLGSHAEGNDAGAIAADKIALPRLQFPLFAFQKLREAVMQQNVTDGSSGMESGGVTVDKRQHFADFFLNHFMISCHTVFSFSPLWPSSSRA